MKTLTRILDLPDDILKKHSLNLRAQARVPASFLMNRLCH